MKGDPARILDYLWAKGIVKLDHSEEKVGGFSGSILFFIFSILYSDKQLPFFAYI